MSFVAILSPAKSLNEKVEMPAQSEPLFLKKSATINKSLKKLDPKALMDLQNISQKLAELNAMRNRDWSVEAHSGIGTPALFTFSGDVYQGIDAETLNPEQVKMASDRLLILSGLYGLLRPMDAMLPYRLEMGTKFSVGKNPDLYAIWQKEITKFINSSYKDCTLVNLASVEYASAIDFKTLKLPVVDVQFKDFSNGKYKIISFFAKKARGYFARFLLNPEVKTIEHLQAFDTDGYFFSEADSNPNKLVFLRG
ncbi:MAG: peroxide stress protein YaaA [Cryomorphaceae bacterium]|nr:peroxide stress protein YaaA [Cryomorphaceae bacterium]